MTAKIEIRGRKQLAEAFDRTVGQARRASAEAVNEIAYQARDRMRVELENHTGRGDESLMVAQEGVTALVGPEKGATNKDPEVYLRFEEFGTVYRPADPFMRPTVDNPDRPAIVAALTRQFGAVTG